MSVVRKVAYCKKETLERTSLQQALQRLKDKAEAVCETPITCSQEAAAKNTSRREEQASTGVVEGHSGMVG